MSDLLIPEFVVGIPRRPEPGVLYVSMEYATTVHLCPCGCGIQVVLPLSPAQWRLSYDGESVSLSPSVGNWQFPCRSHYWIRNSRIHWSTTWSDAQIKRGRRRDAEDLERHYAPPGHSEGRPRASQRGPIAWWSRLMRRRPPRGAPR